ncbi:hypothetical protein H5410_019903 [Solanum commersonii]|uniref:Uncharacterized protein n=1 Tax=Solanum commersonii TaxID=4109 RepID=A0A9J5ZCL1_SOLCO|nr:hypothetical protein H5410_019903 [Solanum commersonii]
MSRASTSPYQDLPPPSQPPDFKKECLDYISTEGKSLVYLINEIINMNCLAAILRGEIGTLPTTYLGMPLGGEYNSIDIWNGVLERCENKLTR